MNIPISLFDLYEILTGKMEPKLCSKGEIIYNPKFLMINLDRLGGFYQKVPQISASVFLMDVKHIIAMSGKYIPVYDQNKNLIYTHEEFLEYSKKVQGFVTHPTGPYVTSEKLDFPGIEKYMAAYDDNEEKNGKENLLALNSLNGVIDKANANILLLKSRRITNYRLVNTGSTTRNTNKLLDSLNKVGQTVNDNLNELNGANEQAPVNDNRPINGIGGLSEISND